jgi:raffinose synthase
VMANSGRLRRDKAFPEIFKYLGWCSWNAHYRDITHDKILEHAVSFERAGIPVRWILVDDGWQSVDNPSSAFDIVSTIHLTDFEADPVRFPGGLKALVKEIESHGITWVGVWHTFQGYWDGVARDSELGRKYADCLFAYDEAGAIPDPVDGRGEKFYRGYYQLLSDSGIDFVKVDNQSTMSRLTRDRIPITDAMAGQQQNLQNAALAYFNSNVINCMEMNIDVVYHWRHTNIGRSSGDYVPALPNNPRAHVLRNVTNAMWFSKLSYPDYDMFMTHDQHPDMHLVARAISGGPIYFTDKAGMEKFDLLLPLIFSDGRILMVDEPALPTRDSLFANPRIKPVPLKAFAKVGKAGIIGAWNVNYLFLPVRGNFGPEDIEGIQGERFAVYDYFSRSVEVMNRTDRGNLCLPAWGVDLKVIVPIQDGIALFGLVDKYISPQAIKNVKQEPGRVKLDLQEGGIFGAYVESRPARIRVNGQDMDSARVRYKDHLLKLDLSHLKGKQVTVEWEK